MRYNITLHTVRKVRLEVADEAIARWATLTLPGRFLGEREGILDVDRVVELMRKNRRFREQLVSAYVSTHPDAVGQTR
ncbi:hypothetical protein [Agromyces bauzanensis]